MELYKQEEDRFPIQLTYANFWIRFIAFLLDGFLTSLLLALVLLALDLPLVPDVTDIESQMKLNLLSVAVGWLYYASFESSSYQATPGKQAMGLFVADTGGYRISFSRASGRYFSKLLSGLLLLLGYIMAAFTPRRQALHDLIAGTLVLKYPLSADKA